MNLCYMCGVDTSDGEFADRLCEPCCAINKTARDLLADLQGRVALITGVRAKLGFECAVKLLQCGANVIAQTVRRPPAYYYELAQKENGSAPLQQHAWSEQREKSEIRLEELQAGVSKIGIADEFIELALKEQNAFWSGSSIVDVCVLCLYSPNMAFVFFFLVCLFFLLIKIKHHLKYLQTKLESSIQIQACWCQLQVERVSHATASSEPTEG